MIIDFLLALGMMLSPASQLRPAGSAVGPGEICIAIWLGLTLLRTIPKFNRLRVTPAVRSIGVFWLLLTAALCAGTLTAFATGMHNDPDKAWHDIQAYILVAMISLFCVIDPMANVRLPRIGWSLASIGTVLLLLQLAHG
ncbi:MAG: O-antigen ligase domain-containing protein, partial [Hyphomicrobiales bacterium]|nr:O-antigen ligase domain-containing protein [Hyphomicrobiales bacterium]